MMTGAFSPNVGKVFSKLKLVTDNLSRYLNDLIYIVAFVAIWSISLSDTQ